jgi:hypothetical protein
MGARLVWLLMRHWLWPFVGVLVVAGVLFAGLLAIDSYARARLAEDERYQVSFADIDCNPPPGLTRSEFLDEIQYYDRSAPTHFSLLDPTVMAKLTSSFTRHPWVYLAAVELKRPNLVHVQVTYRKPVLAVAVTPPPTALAASRVRTFRAIDGAGFVLPKRAPVPGGTVVLEKAPQPKNAEGNKWGDPLVEYAAQTLTCLDSMASVPLRDFQLTRMEWDPDCLVLWGKGMKVLWGKGDISEAEKSVKVQRVLDAGPQRAVLAGWLPLALEIDVRWPDRVPKRLVFRE